MASIYVNDNGYIHYNIYTDNSKYKIIESQILMHDIGISIKNIFDYYINRLLI